MNLFYSPTLSELYNLLEGKDQTSAGYNIIVDNDGEVIIDQHSSVPESKLSQYKFYFNSIAPVFNPGMTKIKSLKFLNQLYKNLLFCWEKGLTGKVDYQSVSRLQNMLYHREINSFRKNDFPISINTYR